MRDRRPRRRASGCRATARPTRPTSPRRWRGRPHRRRAIVERRPVTGIDRRGRPRPGVETDQGDIDCEVVVNLRRAMVAPGRQDVRRHRAAALGRAHVHRHRQDRGRARRTCRCMRDPDGYIYFKEEVGGLVMGGFEPDAKPWGMDGHSRRFRVPAAARRLGPVRDPDAERADPRAGAGERPRSRPLLNGPESFTPDNNFILGEAPERRGRLRRRRLQLGGHRHCRRRRSASRRMDRRRRADERSLAGRHQALRRLQRQFRPGCKDGVKETLGLHYAMPWPNRELAAARPFRRSPLYDRLAAKGARVRLQDGLGTAELFRTGRKS